jgi:hypothetical protein
LVEIRLFIEVAQRRLQVRVGRRGRQALDVKRQIVARALGRLRRQIADRRRGASPRHIAPWRLLASAEL